MTVIRIDELATALGATVPELLGLVAVGDSVHVPVDSPNLASQVDSLSASHEVANELAVEWMESKSGIAKNGNAWSFEGQFIDASRRGSVKLTSSGGAYVRQRYDELRLIHADPSTLIVDASGVSAAYVIRPGDQITESVVVSMFGSESVSESDRAQTETTDYTADDAKRLLAAGIADDQACGYCNGRCASCQQEAAEVIAKIRAEVLREAVEVARGQIPAVALGDSDFRQGMISGQIRFAAWLEGRAESEVQS